jgi:molybdopterin-guanine dinucleotide biosynthesis protein A
MLTVSTIILAGGKAKRFGQNKATVLLMGKSLLEWVIKRVEPVSDEILIVSGEPVFAFQDLKIRVVPDLFPNLGPLGGLYSGLNFSRNEMTFAFGCDMPFLNLQLLRYMLQISSGFDAVVPRIFGQIQPLHSLYSRRCLPALKNDLEHGLLKLTLTLERLNLRYLEEKEARKFDPQLLSFFNINSPVDLEKALILGKRAKISESNELY